MIRSHRSAPSSTAITTAALASARLAELLRTHRAQLVAAVSLALGRSRQRRRGDYAVDAEDVVQDVCLAWLAEGHVAPASKFELFRTLERMAIERIEQRRATTFRRLGA